MRIGKLRGVQISKISLHEMVLQIRDLDGHSMLVAVLPQEAKAIAAALNAVANQFSGVDKCDASSAAPF